MSEAPAPMQVSYVFDFTDYMALCSAVSVDPRVRRHNRKWRNLIWSGGFGITVGALILAHLIEWTDSPTLIGSLIGASLFLFLAFLIDQFTRRAQLQSIFSLNRLCGRKITFALTEEGVESHVGAMRAITGWPDFVRFSITPTYLLLFVSSLEAFIFPCRAFASKRDFTNAVKFAEEKFHGQTV